MILMDVITVVTVGVVQHERPKQNIVVYFYVDRCGFDSSRGCGVKERPILFNTEMVKAILEGRKTQTRRVVKPQPTTCNDERGGHWWPSNAVQSMVHVEKELQDYDGIWGGLIDVCNPFGEKGDCLWVRETFCYGTIDEFDAEHPLDRYLYVEQTGRVDEDYPVYKQWCLENNAEIDEVAWKPSIHMPRSASRILLEITNIRVERLNEISSEDAKAEGFDYSTHPSAIKMGYAIGAKTNFRHTWQEIYGTESWDQNPWVWVVEFKVIKGGAA